MIKVYSKFLKEYINFIDQIRVSSSYLRRYTRITCDLYKIPITADPHNLVDKIQFCFIQNVFGLAKINFSSFYSKDLVLLLGKLHVVKNACSFHL